ncbi:helix-turn-helix domain-containing protein [Vagococcus sp. DIV0080]|uniref:Helix-turn-helix domain-containing protein n=1 Tax=Candidatus Vagococcus giribetii TaxID=2230876 RepID=A0ABS3HTJ8_9ENTE|nr:helix-turn-helix domain-containing protein [Vagococcus sp. DIV0080]
MHVNTLRSRLKKVETLLHVDLNASNDLLNIQLALKLYEKSVFLHIDH